MTQLKTLKDLEINHIVKPHTRAKIDVNGLITQSWEQKIIQPMDLRKEAIKWIKEGRKTYKTPLGIIERRLQIGNRLWASPDIIPIEEWIKHFFNITEEDLKLAEGKNA